MIHATRSRSEKALVASLAEMYVQGVSTRKVKAITEELCGHSFSASTISRINQTLDKELRKFATRALEEEYPNLILDARYEKVREDGVIRSRAVLVAIGINWDGRRGVLAVELAERESTTSWRELLLSLKQRGLCGVEFVVTDDHAGLKKAASPDPSGSCGRVAPGNFTPRTGWPEAVARLRLPQNAACGFPALRSSELDLQHSERLELPIAESQLGTL